VRHLQTRLALLIVAALLFGVEMCCDALDNATSSPAPPLEAKRMTTKLPAPKFRSTVSIEETLATRRSIRDYSGKPLTLEELSQLLWAAQGITAAWGARTAPSAGALYPLEVYALAGNVQGLAPGVYRYVPKDHELVQMATGDLRAQLAGAALGQDSVRTAALALVFTAVPARTTGKYGERGHRYVLMEAGHAAQNVHLQAVALGLGTVPVGAFDDQKVTTLLNLPKGETPLYIIPVGRP
jgi:SagB-type dehydrogenase family enzyme